jgi:hypothetical protein
MLANFLGVLPILTPPLCALAFIMCSKSNPLGVFALDLMSTYEGEHTIFGLLGQSAWRFESSKLVTTTVALYSQCSFRSKFRYHIFCAYLALASTLLETVFFFSVVYL